jgi:hypothetical protein
MVLVRAAAAVVSLFLIAAIASAGETAEAAKVAGWVKALPAVAADDSWFGALGAISMGQVGDTASTIRSVGTPAFYNDTAKLQSAISFAQMRATTYLPPLVAGDLAWFRDVQNFPWGMIEVANGTYRFELIDAVVAGAQLSGGRYVGVAMPFAGWEQVAAGNPIATEAECLRLINEEDYFYLAFDKRMGRYKNLTEWQNYLSTIVERYDGDGVSDMAGLKTPVKYWQIHNEPEGANCGLFRNDVPGFVELMRVSYAAVHAACSDCKVLNGGAGIRLFDETRVPPPAGTTFWRDFAAMGGAQYVDVIAVHYNEGKDADHGKIDDFEYQVSRMRELLGTSKPVWVTEFGTLIGNTGGGPLMGVPEAEAGAWFVRFYTAGLAAGVNRFYPDAVAFATFPSGTIELPYYINKLLLARLGGFTSAQRVATGQYKFRVNGADAWVLWNGVPSSLTGSVVATDMYGNETTVNATKLTPSETAPLIVRSAAITRRHAVGHR